jgi:hypothetical protein
MNISTPVYQQSQRVVLDPRKKVPNPYFGLSPSEHEEEFMRYAMQLEDTLECDHLPDRLKVNDAEFYLNEMKKIEERIERFKRNQRLKYRWPDRKPFEETKHLAQEMKHQYPLERFIQDHILQCNIRDMGDSWLGNCPIPTHDDRTPSFRVYDSIRFHCYGCEARGDVYELIGLVYGIERFPERVEYLAELMA